MNLQSLVIVLLRLMSLNLLLQSATQFFPVLFRLGMMYQSVQSGDLSFGLPWVMVSGFIGGAALLWMFAPSIASFVTNGLPGELSFGSFSLADCYTVVFIAVGLVNVVSQFPSILYWGHFALIAAPSQPGAVWDYSMRSHDIFNAVTRFIVGILLIVSARKWATALARRQMQNEPPPPSIPPQAKDVS